MSLKGKDEIAKACRTMDAKADSNQPFESILEGVGVDAKGLAYVAEQRALRAYAEHTGQSRNAKGVTLLEGGEELMARLASVWLDGFIAARHLEDNE